MKPLSEVEFKEAIFKCVAYMVQVGKTTRVDIDMGKVTATLEVKVNK